MRIGTGAAVAAAVLSILLPAVGAQETSGTDPLIRSLEERHQTVLSRGSRVTVSIRVQRKEEQKEKTKRDPTQIPMLTGGVLAKRPVDLPCSGMIVDPEGLILTTAFNVGGEDVESVRVTLPDGTEKPATVVGFTESYDVALLQVEAKDLPTLTGVDLDRLLPGQPVLAVGRSPDGTGLTVNPGILSAVGRDGGRTFQVDCRLNYGNVGGPVLDAAGNLIGMACKVRTSDAAAFGPNSGVAFVLPWDQIRKVLPDLRAGMRIEMARGAFLGISGQNWEDGEGIELVQVFSGSAAQQAGLENGDIVTEIDGTKVKGMEELRDAILRKKVGDVVKVRFLRNGEEREVEATLGERGGA